MHRWSIATSIFLSLLSGCSVTHKTVGSFDDYNEVFVGDVVSNLANGTGVIEAEIKNSKIRCTGTSRTTYAPPFSFNCAGQRGEARMTCTDGRVMTVDWQTKSCAVGFGEGRDQNGATFRFVFGLDEKTAMDELVRQKSLVAKKPDLPIYRPQETRREKGFATGTGFFVSADGHLLTNFHVIENAKSVKVFFKGKELDGKVLRVDRAGDVALVKVETVSKPLSIAPSSILRRGDEIFTLGYPLIALQGQEQKASFGRVNALSGVGDDSRFLQMDASIQPGNSGGPLFDKSGRVVGIVTATLSALATLRSSGALPQNVNYAMKSEYATPLLEGLNKHATPPASNTSLPDVISTVEDSVVLIISR
jgi:S1-C subfamily serine protease